MSQEYVFAAVVVVFYAVYLRLFFTRKIYMARSVPDVLNRFFRLEEINGLDRCPTYLYRWTLFHSKRFGGFGIYLHHFVGDDWSRDLHDHPKRFISIGLKGAYVEETPVPSEFQDGTRAYLILNKNQELILRDDGRYALEATFRAPWVRSFPAEHIHRLRLIDGRPCWTIVVVLRSVREWGFWSAGKWVHWKTYVNSDAATHAKSCPD